MGREIRISMACIGERVARYNETSKGFDAELYTLPLPRRK
jgi:hypothetical protein